MPYDGALREKDTDEYLSDRKIFPHSRRCEQG